MTTEYSPFARPKFSAEDFARNDETGRFDDQAATFARPRAPIEEPRSFMADDDRLLGSDPVMEAELAREDEILLDRPITPEVESSTFAATPVYANRATTKSRSASTDRKIPMAALVAVPAVVLMAGVGYMALSGGAQQTAPQTAPSEAVAVAPAAPSFSEPTEMAAVTPPPVTPATPAPAEAAPAPRQTTSAEAPTRVARARPAPASAATASSAGVDASATLPEAPMPYSGTAQIPAPAPASATAAAAAVAPAPIIVPPVTAEPVNPAPTAVTPAPEPSAPETAAPEITPPTL